MSPGEAAMAQVVLDTLLILCLGSGICGLVALCLWPFLPGARRKRAPFSLPERR